MNVIFTVTWEIVVDDETDLLDIDTTSPDVSSDEDSAITTPEFIHDSIPILLLHFTMHSAHSKVSFTHFISKPVDLFARVAEYHSLCDGEGVVEVAECVEFPLLFFNSDEELFDTFECNLIALNENADRISHELGGHFEYIVREGG